MFPNLDDRFFDSLPDELTPEMLDAMIEQMMKMSKTDWDKMIAMQPAETAMMMRPLLDHPEALRQLLKDSLPEAYRVFKSDRGAGLADQVSKMGYGMGQNMASNPALQGNNVLSWLWDGMTGGQPQPAGGMAAIASDLSGGAWSLDLDRGIQACQDEDYVSARRYLDRALAVCEKDAPDGLGMLTVLRQLSMTANGLGDLGLEEGYLKRWIKLGEAKLGNGHPELAYAYSMLAYVRERQGKKSDADTLHTHALKMVESVPGERHADLLAILDGMASYYYRQENFKRVEANLTRIVTLLEEHSEDPEEMSDYLSSLADVRMRLNKHDQAELDWRRLVKILDQAGEDDEMSLPLLKLCCCLAAQNKIDAAVGMFAEIQSVLPEASLDDAEEIEEACLDFADALEKSGAADKANDVREFAERRLFKTFEIGAELKAGNTVINLVADLWYRPVEGGDEVDTQALGACVQKVLESSLGGVNFINLVNNAEQVSESLEEALVPAARQVGADVAFAFSQVSDSAGYSTIISQVTAASRDAIEGQWSEAEAVFEEALDAARKTGDKMLLKYVTDSYVPWLRARDQHVKAKELETALSS